MMTIYNNKRIKKILLKFQIIIIIIYKLIMIYKFTKIVLLWNKENLYLLYKPKERMIILKIAFKNYKKTIQLANQESLKQI